MHTVIPMTVLYVITFLLSAVGNTVTCIVIFGIKHKLDEFGNIREETANCNVVRHLFPYVFEVSSVLFFVVPMMIITLLYVLIGLRLRRSGRSRHMSRGSMHGGGSGTGAGAIAARRAVIKMLVAVVVAFFICWAPFHAQRLLAISVPDKRSEVVNAIMQGLYRVSGVLYFVSTCVNPILYHIMSAKFRQAVRCLETLPVVHQLAVASESSTSGTHSE
ncbi:Pyrokinin-1 receptor [Amphibalanus amphitrite]|uniref:Pyrokinin-1 receptor n=1 Tax=Amphibalanus amphitrite TaxID=1232801 RepID=A0A6A4VXV6_AMPAM|nr:Pyrokinin-1 receptor [Amphibalanus amphitrite]